MTNNNIEELDEKLSQMMDTMIDGITSLQNMVADIKRKQQQCAPDLIQTGIKSPEIKKKKTITAIDLGWQKGFDDNCVQLTYTDGTAPVVEFDTFLDMSLCFSSRVLSYDFAPEMKITMGAEKIHSKTLFDLLRMLTQEKHYIINEYDYDNRVITLFKNNWP